jgi:hypothetical protein
MIIITKQRLIVQRISLKLVMPINIKGNKQRTRNTRYKHDYGQNYQTQIRRYKQQKQPDNISIS